MPSLRSETRYGMLAADQVIFNRHYVLGYSYYFRRAKWALEIIDPDNPGLARVNNFRSDYRIPEMFRADLVDYKGSGYERGHLVASANQRETVLQNSETFSLSNASPQKGEFNRQIWKRREAAIRDLCAKPKVLETYVICGPIFYFDRLVESNRGTLNMWSFVLPNEESSQSPDEFQVSTNLVEKLAGVKLWKRLVGRKIDREKSRIRKMWL